MKTLHIQIKDKIATYVQRDGAVVCGNTDYQIAFTFDSEWDEYPDKTARFIWNGQHFDQPFTGNICPMPMVFDTTTCTVGVYVEDLETTTPAKIDCLRSILCGNTKKFEGNDKVYADEAKESADKAKNAAQWAIYSADRAEQAAQDAEESVNEALTKAKASGEFNGLTPYIGENGNWWIGNTDTGIASGGVHIGSDEPPVGIDVWLDPVGDPDFGSETWVFTKEDDTTVTKDVVVLD